LQQQWLGGDDPGRRKLLPLKDQGGRRGEELRWGGEEGSGGFGAGEGRGGRRRSTDPSTRALTLIYGWDKPLRADNPVPEGRIIRPD